VDEAGVGDALDRRATDAEAGEGLMLYEIDDRLCSEPGVAGEGDEVERPA
jgi:hypothetical protein